MARVEALPQRLGQSHNVDVPHTGREWAVRTVKHRFTCRDLHADVRVRPPGAGQIVQWFVRRKKKLQVYSCDAVNGLTPNQD